MKINRYTTLVEAQQALRRKGYTNRFELLENDVMCCVETQKKYTADKMRIAEYHRFEGDSNPADMSIIFAVICHDNTRGTIISAFGPYANIKLSVFLDKVKIMDRTKMGN